MNDLTITEGETGLVRVFVLVRPADLPRGQSLPLSQIARWMGVASLNEADVQQLWTDDLADMPLPDFLAAGYGIDEGQLSAQAEVLEGVMDLHPTLLVVVRSSAFVDRPQILVLDGPLHLLATLHEPGVEVAFERLPNPDPDAVLSDAPQKKQPSDAAMSGRIAMIALLVMALLVVLMVWIAG